MNKKITDFDFMEIFPENLKRYKNLNKLAQLAVQEIRLIPTPAIQLLALYENMEQEPDEILSELAYGLNVDNWSESLDRDVKIRLIKKAYWTHSKKGTKSAVIMNLESLGYPIELEEWFEETNVEDQVPFTYALTINGQQLEEGWLAQINEIINKYKNCRSIMRVAKLKEKPSDGYLRVHCLITTKEYQEIPIDSNFESTGNLRVACFIATKEIGVIN